MNVRGQWIAAVLVVLGLAVFVVPLVAAPPAYACSCASFTDKQYFERADLVFTGTLVDREEPPSGGTVSSADPVTLTFEVERVYKGSAVRDLDLTTARSSASCGLELEGRGPFLVFATDRGGLTAGLCDGSRPLNKKIPASFGEGTPARPLSTSEPAPTSSRETAPAEEDGPPSWIYPAGVAVLLGAALAGAGALWARRRRSRE